MQSRLSTTALLLLVAALSLYRRGFGLDEVWLKRLWRLWKELLAAEA